MLMTRNGSAVVDAKASYWSNILIIAPVMGPCRNITICHNVWCGKTRTVWLPDSEEKFKDVFICFDTIHERDGRRDRRTPHDAALVNGIARQN